VSTSRGKAVLGFREICEPKVRQICAACRRFADADGMSRLRASFGILPDDLYVEPEPWPRIGRPPKHDVEAWTVTDDWPNPVPKGISQFHRLLTRPTYVGRHSAFTLLF
jgi:hypothetical protein